MRMELDSGIAGLSSPQAQAGQCGLRRATRSQRDARRREGDHSILAQVPTGLEDVTEAVAPYHVNRVADSPGLFLPIDIMVARGTREPHGFILEYSLPAAPAALDIWKPTLQHHCASGRGQLAISGGP